MSPHRTKAGKAPESHKLLASGTKVAAQQQAARKPSTIVAAPVVDVIPSIAAASPPKSKPMKTAPTPTASAQPADDDDDDEPVFVLDAADEEILALAGDSPSLRAALLQRKEEEWESTCVPRDTTP